MQYMKQHLTDKFPLDNLNCNHQDIGAILLCILYSNLWKKNIINMEIHKFSKLSYLSWHKFQLDKCYSRIQNSSIPLDNLNSSIQKSMFYIDLYIEYKFELYLRSIYLDRQISIVHLKGKVQKCKISSKLNFDKKHMEMCIKYSFVLPYLSKCLLGRPKDMKKCLNKSMFRVHK